MEIFFFGDTALLDIVDIRNDLGHLGERSCRTGSQRTVIDIVFRMGIRFFYIYIVTSLCKRSSRTHGQRSVIRITTDIELRDFSLVLFFILIQLLFFIACAARQNTVIVSGIHKAHATLFCRLLFRHSRDRGSGLGLRLSLWL